MSKTATESVLVIGNRIAVRRDEAESKSKGGLVLPDSAKQKPQRGQVVEVGPGRMLDDGTRADMQIDVGDTVIFNAYAGSEITVGDEQLVIMSEEDVLAIVR